MSTITPTPAAPATTPKKATRIRPIEPTTLYRTFAEANEYTGVPGWAFDIIDGLLRAEGIGPDDFVGKKRPVRLVRARRIAAALLRWARKEGRSLSYPEIARACGGDAHSVIHERVREVELSDAGAFIAAADIAKRLRVPGVTFAVPLFGTRDPAAQPDTAGKSAQPAA